MPHPLEDYLAAAGDRVEDFAARVGVEAARLRRVIAGEEAPDPALARRIVEAAGGAVLFESLYGGEVAAFPARDDEAIDPVRLAPLVEAALRETGMAEADAVLAAPVAAEAIADACAALARVTTRRGPDRLLQALRPVFAEILTETPDLCVPSDALDRAAALAAQRYFSPPR